MHAEMDAAFDEEKRGGSREGGMVSTIGAAVRAQWAAAVMFWQTPLFRYPMLVVWVASIGGALHEPVITFFYLRLGATDIDVGAFGFVKQIGTLVLAPIYGAAIDRKGAYPVMVVSCFFCALGCLCRGLAPNVRGLYIGNLILGLGAANLWTSVLSYVSLQTPRAERSTMVSAFLVQVSLLRMVGRAMYPGFNAGLRIIIADVLVRDRVIMSVCTIFCAVGIVALLLDPYRQDTTKVARELEEREQQGNMEAGVQRKGDWHAQSGSQEAAMGLHQSVKPSTGGFVLVSLVLVVQAAAVTMARVLWPLFLHDRFGWGASQYAYLLLLSEVCSAATMAVFPSIEKRLGRFRTAALGCSVAGLLATLAFQAGERDGVQMAFHAAIMVALLAVSAGLEPSLKSLASLHMPQHLQGASFGWMSVSSGVGTMAGSMSGAYLYSISKAMGPTAVTGGGALPLVAIGAFLVAASGILQVTSRIRPNTDADCLDGITAAMSDLASGQAADRLGKLS